MITQFEDYCLWMYVVVHELWPTVAPLCRRPGPAPGCSDSELVTMVLVGESRGWDEETELVGEWRARRDLFPVVPERSRFNRRRRALAPAINELRRAQLAYADVRARGYPIGSGAVESANKLVVEPHLKGSGMHWLRANVSPMVSLRALLCSDRWTSE